MPLRVSAPGPRRAGVVLILLLAPLAAGLAIAGFFAYRSYERNFRVEVENYLVAVADLKVSELARWRRQRLGDGSVFCGNPAFSGLVRRWFEAPDDEGTQARIRAWLGNVQAAYQYDRLILLDARGVPRMSVPEPPEPEAAHVAQDALEVLRSGRASFRDFHRDATDGPIHLAVLAPILDADDSRSLGVVVLRIDPERYLYPLLQRWPAPSGTAETLLVRRDGNDVLYLNELRFQKGTALRLRWPLTDTNLPAVKAALGREGVEEGVDYRGVPVVAAVRVVPDSPWSLVARLDTAEVYAPLRERLWMLVALVGLTLLAAGAGLGFVWRKQELRSARERCRVAEALDQSEARFRLFAETAPIGMAQADPRTGKWLAVNGKMCAITGYSESELLGLRVSDVTHPEDRAADWEAFQRVVRGEAPSYRIEKRYLRKDASEVWVSVNMTVLRDAAGAPLRTMAVIEDVTERRRTEQDLRLKDIVFETSLASSSIADGDGIIRHVNSAFLRLWGFESREAAIGQPIGAFFADARDAAPVLEALQDTGAWEGEFLARRRDGATFLSRGLATVVRDASGALIGYQSTNLDVSGLRDAEELFRLAAESSNDVIYEWDLRQDLRWFGDVDGLTGHLPGGFPRTLDGWTEALHPEDRERVVAAVRAHLSERAPYSVEYRVRARDESYRWWSARGVVARLADGTPTRWIGTITDVTDRQRGEEALRASEHFLDSVFEQSPHAMWISDSRGTLIRMNQACRDLLRITDAEVVGKYNVLEDNVVSEQGHLELVRRVFEHGETARFTIEYQSARLALALDRHVSVVLDVTMSAVPGADGGVAHVIVQHVDITDRVRAEEAVALQKRIAEIFLSVPDDAMFYEVLKVVLEVMDSRFGVFGYLDEKGDLVVPTMTRDVWDKCQVPEKSITFPRDTWGDSSWPRAIRERTPNSSNEVSTKTPEGHVSLRRHVSLPILLQGEVIGLFQVANKETDYTEADVRRLGTIAEYVAPVMNARLLRERTEEGIRRLNAGLEQRVVERTERLEVANQELEAFSYSVSHDLRAPLRHIDGYVGLLLERCRGELTDQGRHYLDTIADSARQMGRLIDELLRFSRTGRAEMRPGAVDMNRTLREALDSLAGDLTGRSIEWVVGNLPPTSGDGALLRLVWANLLGNATKYTRGKDQARIEVGALEGSDETTFFVRDDGVGFDMRYAHKLFGVFQRLHSETEFEGTGIGLATVRRIVSRHGGRTWAEGEPRAGATFYFSLPRPAGGEACRS